MSFRYSKRLMLKYWYDNPPFLFLLLFYQIFTEVKMHSFFLLLSENHWAASPRSNSSKRQGPGQGRQTWPRALRQPRLKDKQTQTHKYINLRSFYGIVFKISLAWDAAWLAEVNEDKLGRPEWIHLSRENSERSLRCLAGQTRQSKDDEDLINFHHRLS